jgi:type IV pilus assembly protein PilM
VNLDYEILDAGTGQDTQGSMEVLLVAAKKDKIADYTNVISQAGRTPVVVDVDVFALQNAFEANYGFEPNAVVALLNAGASAININILSGSQSVFTRDVSTGGNAFTEAVQKELNLPYESAEQLKKGPGRRRRDLRRRAGGAARDDRQRAARSREDVRLLQGDGVERPHRSHHAVRRRLARGGLRLNRCVNGSERKWNSSTRSARSPCDAKKLGIDNVDEFGPVAAVAMGLALRKVGDR